MPRPRYRTDFVPHWPANIEHHINKFTRKGWELVSMGEPILSKYRRGLYVTVTMVRYA